jgi:hypothetical protein
MQEQEEWHVKRVQVDAEALMVQARQARRQCPAGAAPPQPPPSQRQPAPLSVAHPSCGGRGTHRQPFSMLSADARTRENGRAATHILQQCAHLFQAARCQHLLVQLRHAQLIPPCHADQGVSGQPGSTGRSAGGQVGWRGSLALHGLVRLEKGKEGEGRGRTARELGGRGGGKAEVRRGEAMVRVKERRLG